MVPSSTSLRQRFADNLRELRKSRGLTQEELAEKAGLHRTYVGSVERGERNVTIDSMDRLAKALDVSVWMLLHPDGPQHR
jgi:transcriptional regulator with XRE-family HTH domain